MNLLRFAAGAFAAGLLFTPSIARAAGSDPRAAQVIAASGKALGIASLASVRRMRIDCSISLAGLRGTLTQYVGLRGGQFAESTNVGPLIQLDGYDGGIEWSGDGSHLVWNDGGDSDRASEINQAYLESYALWRPNSAGATVASIGTKSAGGRTYDALRITPAGSMVPFELWFDAATHLPAQAHFVNGFTTSTLTFSDYRRVGGFNFAYAIHVDSSDGNNLEIAVTRLTLDPPNAQTALTRPQTRPTDFSMQNGKT